MPLNIKDIEVDFIEIGEEDELYNTEYACTICQQPIYLNRSNDWKPVPHKLDHCLRAIMRTINFMAEESGLAARINILRLKKDDENVN